MNYYNEHDPKAAAWLRELIKQGHIPAGEVDTRSIVDVQPGDLSGFTQCHFFAGIGGWSYALKLAGVSAETKLWTGSCPCQPFSCAGQGKGEADPRHLWPHFRRLIAERRPATIFGEQVASSLGRRWLAGVRTDLENSGYAVGAADLCAASVGAPHIRQRLFWVANAQGRGCGEQWRAQESRNIGHADGRREVSGVGLAYSNGEQTHAADARGLHAESCGDSGASGMAVANGAELQRESSAGEQSLHEQVQGIGWMGNAESDNGGGEQHEEGTECGRPGPTGASGNGVGGLDDTDSERGRSGPAGIEDAGDAGDPSEVGGFKRQGFWGSFDLIPCRDGKARRVEPGTFPLVNGFPARVDLLRGYGNAIVPQIAAEFIQASIEAITETNP